MPANVVFFGPKANCTLDICPIQSSVYGYRPNLAVNVLFTALFAIAFVIHVYLGIRWRRWFFMACMLLGCICAVGGYIGRVMMYYNPWSFAAFMLQTRKFDRPKSPSGGGMLACLLVGFRSWYRRRPCLLLCRHLRNAL